MANQHEVDYEKQFQEDLAKATALSLEQQALDDYRRAKKYGTSAVAGHLYERTLSQTSSPLQHSQSLHTQHNRQQSTESATAYYAQLRSRYQQSRGNSVELTPPPLAQSTSGPSATPPPVPHRRYSDINNATVSAALAANAASTRERSRTPPPTLPESDLISFSSPTSKQPQNSTFEKLIEDLQKLQTTNPQTALMPLGPTAAAPMALHSARYRSAPSSVMYPAAAPQYPVLGGAAAGVGLQLVPFIPPAQQRKAPLTQDELQKLYNMPHQQQQLGGASYPQGHMGFVHPGAAYAAPHLTQSAPPSAAATAAYMAPQYPTVPRFAGFQYAGLPPSTANYYTQPSTLAIVGPATTNSSIPSDNAHASPGVVKSQSASSAASVLNGTAGCNSSGSAAVLRRQTQPTRRHTRTGADLIDLSQEDDSRVSVLEAFDPLLNTDDEVTKK